MAKVILASAAQQQFERLPRVIQKRMLTLFERLKAWPDVSGAKPLRGRLAGWYRLRTGDYRLQFQVEGDNVLIEKLGHRDQFYGS